MSTSIKEHIQSALKESLKAGQKQRLGTVRLMLAAIRQREIDERIVLNDEQALAVLDKMVKQRRDSVQQYTAAGRLDLASAEQAEIEIIQEFLPAALDAAEIERLIDAAFNETQAGGMQDMGKVMAILKPQMQGRADLKAISQKVKTRLAG